jgi:integrase/recombinase XerC
MLAEIYFSWLSTERRYSQHSLKAYRSDIYAFSDFIKQQFETNDLTKVTAQMIRSWVVWLKENSNGNSSINRKISSIRSFYRFCQRNNYIDQNPAEKIQSLKVRKSLPEFVTRDLMLKITENSQADNFVMIRNGLVIDLLYQTGIRLSELTGIQEADIHFGNSSLNVRGKGNKERIIPFHNTLKSALTDYLTEKHRLFGRDQKALFVTNNGKPAYNKMIYRIVHTLLSAETTLQKTSPHILRHTFATHLLNNGASILAIKELLGHSSLAATQIYTHNTIEQLKSIHKQAHPKG